MDEENKQEKLDFNFDFLGDDNAPLNQQDTKIEKIISKINNISNSIKNNADISLQIDVLVEDISITSEALSNNAFYDDIFYAAKICIEKLKKYQKYNDALKLTKFIYNLPKSDANQKACKKLLSEIIEQQKQANNKKATYTVNSKKIINKKNNDNFYTIFWIISGLVVIILTVIIIATNYNKNQTEIRQLETQAYSLYVKNNENIPANTKSQYLAQLNLTLDKLAQKENRSVDEIKSELQKRYTNDKNQAVSDLAYYYQNDKTEFDNLKQTALPKYFHNNIDELNKAVDNHIGYRLLQLKQQPLPRTGLIKNYTGRPAIASFTITTDNMHCYIKMYDSVSGQLAFTVFAPANKKIKTYVPLGNYIMKTASGYTWYGFKDLFGHDTAYEQKDQIIDFYTQGDYIIGKILELKGSVDGNLKSTDINPNEF